MGENGLQWPVGTHEEILRWSWEIFLGKGDNLLDTHRSHATSMPDAAQPVNRILLSLSQETNSSRFWHHLVPFDISSMVHLRSSLWYLPDILICLFPNAHHHDSLSQQLRVVWSQFLQTGFEGPTLIFYTALPFTAFVTHYRLGIDQPPARFNDTFPALIIRYYVGSPAHIIR